MKGQYADRECPICQTMIPGIEKICPNCKTEYDPPANMRNAIEALGGNVETFYEGIGCNKCRNTGYSGRIAIHELFVPEDELLEMINEKASLTKIRDKAVEKGMVSLLRDGFEKVKAGIVSAEEILRFAQ